MQMTNQQLQALDNGEPVPLDVEGRHCVLVPGNLFEQLRATIDDWHPQTMKRQMAAIMADDWTDPTLSVYDE